MYSLIGLPSINLLYLSGNTIFLLRSTTNYLNSKIWDTYLIFLQMSDSIIVSSHQISRLLRHFDKRKGNEKKCRNPSKISREYFFLLLRKQEGEIFLSEKNKQYC